MINQFVKSTKSWKASLNLSSNAEIGVIFLSDLREIRKFDPDIYDSLVSELLKYVAGLEDDVHAVFVRFDLKNIRDIRRILVQHRSQIEEKHKQRFVESINEIPYYSVTIEYDAQNSFGTPLRHTARVSAAKMINYPNEMALTIISVDTFSK